ncbi:NYN domain-containing protein [Cellulomonas sp. P22]|uniref:NYN domain-containing protein n=1 Tax=Cellulomonas sp. P22 TaxID=3373189 RepID=UPI0037A7E553
MTATTIVADRPEPVRSFRCALFVDFDNVYIGLRRLDPAAADAFANNPAHWLSELEQGTDSEGEFTRRFLVRACYLNPSAFSQFRPNFTRAGFQVVDCPSLTQQGKSSADINLVLDAVDALMATTRYEEFVIVSADADFTPLALRCRADDRRVTIITAGPAAAAYRAVADAVVTADDLAEMVMPAVETATVAEVVAAPEVSRGRTAPAVVAEPVVVPESSSPGRRAALRSVRAADRPMLAGTVAQLAQKADPTLSTTRWEGTGSFFAWLAQHVPEVSAASRPAPGFVWDPKRFGEADLPGAVADVDPSALQRQVVAVTDTPGLSAKQYRVVLTALAADLATHPFERAETSRRVRDVCRAEGALVGRSTVNYVISGVLFSGLTLEPGTSARDLAEAWAANVVGLCRGARMELSPGDVAAIRAWVGGGLLDA